MDQSSVNNMLEANNECFSDDHTIFLFLLEVEAMQILQFQYHTVTVNSFSVMSVFPCIPSARRYRYWFVCIVL